MSEAEEARDYESEARQEGWVPEEEFQGDKPPEKFLDAKTFVERGEKISGVLKSKLSKVEQELQAVKEQNATANAEFKKFHEKALEKERREKAELVKQLEAKREAAISEGDGQTFTQVDRELNELRSEVPDKKSTHNDMVQAWVDNNQWYVSDEKLAAYADGIAERVQAQGYTGQAYFSELTRRVKETFPESFNPPKPPPVTGGKVSEDSPNAQSFDNLPQDAKDAFKRFSKSFGVSKEEYLANYDWDQA